MSLVTLLMLEVNDMTSFEREGFFDSIGDFALWCKNNNMITTGGKRTNRKNKKTRRKRNKTRHMKGGVYGTNLVASNPTKQNAIMALDEIDSEEPATVYRYWVPENRQFSNRLRASLMASQAGSVEETDVINAISTFFEKLKKYQEKAGALMQMRLYTATVLVSQAAFLWFEYEKNIMLEEAKYNASFTAVGDKLVDKLTWAFSKTVQLAGWGMGMNFNHEQCVTEFQKGRQKGYQALALALMKPAMVQAAMQIGIDRMFSTSVDTSNLDQQMDKFKKVSDRSLTILAAGIKENAIIANEIRTAEANVSNTGYAMVAGAALFAVGVPQLAAAKTLASTSAAVALVPKSIKLAAAASATDKFLDRLNLDKEQKTFWKLEIDKELRKSYTETLQEATDSLPTSAKEQLSLLNEQGKAIAFATETGIKQFIANGGDPTDCNALSAYVSTNLFQFMPKPGQITESGLQGLTMENSVRNAAAEQRVRQPVVQGLPRARNLVKSEWICPNPMCNMRNSTFPLSNICQNCQSSREADANQQQITYDNGDKEIQTYFPRRLISASSGQPRSISGASVRDDRFSSARSANSVRSGQSTSISGASVRDDDSRRTYPDGPGAVHDDDGDVSGLSEDEI